MNKYFINVNEQHEEYGWVFEETKGSINFSKEVGGTCLYEFHSDCYHPVQDQILDLIEISKDDYDKMIETAWKFGEEEIGDYELISIRNDIIAKYIGWKNI